MRKIKALLAVALIALTSSAMAVSVNFQFEPGVSDFAKQAAEQSGKSVAMIMDESSSDAYKMPLRGFMWGNTVTLSSAPASGSVKITTLGITDGPVNKDSIDPGSCDNSAVLNTTLGSTAKVTVLLNATTSGDVSVTSCEIQSSSTGTNTSSTDANTAQ
ncbi:MAG: hypothetical protein GY820_01080 [Gammaproteobacteria bacterium]|nr:hypothetical protein [Gammaproteobacteria bacterium]